MLRVAVALVLLPQIGHAQDQPAAVAAKEVAQETDFVEILDEIKLSPVEGVADIKLKDIYKPIGDYGLEFSDFLKNQEGKQVRLAGFIASQDLPDPASFLLTQFPLILNPKEYGLADDLPPTVVHVTLPDKVAKLASARSGGMASCSCAIKKLQTPFVVTGKLELGRRVESDGRVSWVRIDVDETQAKELLAMTQVHSRPVSH